MTVMQHVITIAMCAIGTMTTRFLPFLIFRGKKETPAYVKYLGKALPAAIFGRLLIYCLKDVSVFSGHHALPEILSLAFIAAIHLRRRNTLLSIAGGTVLYMLLVQFVFL